MLPLYVHIKTAREALSAERVYDVHCTTYGSRPSALVTWWLGTTQLLDHSSQVQYHFVQFCKQTFDKSFRKSNNLVSHSIHMLNIQIDTLG